MARARRVAAHKKKAAGEELTKEEEAWLAEGAADAQASPSPSPNPSPNPNPSPSPSPSPSPHTHQLSTGMHSLMPDGELHISAYLPISPHISPYLPISRHISQVSTVVHATMPDGDVGFTEGGELTVLHTSPVSPLYLPYISPISPRAASLRSPG